MSKLFIGNWKMSLPDEDALALARAYAAIASECRAWDVAVAPSFLALERVARELADSPVALAAQDGSPEGYGAHTGDVAMADIAALGARFVIVGHSERRRDRGVDDAFVARQVSAALEHGLRPVICVGETAEEKAEGRRDEVVRSQLAAVLRGAPDPARLLVAYEPRWAIGTGDACRPEDALEVHRLVRGSLRDRYGDRDGSETPVLYGGSVDADNVASYVSLEGIDGVLVGGASTKIEQVKAILCGS